MHYLGYAFQKLIKCADDLGITMSIYYLLENIDNYLMATGSFYNYYRGKIDDADVNNNVSDGKAFGYKPKIVEGTPGKPPRIQETQTNQRNRHYYPKLLFYSYHNSLWRSTS